MVVFKAIILGLLGWELFKLLRRKKEKPSENYIIVPADKVPDNLKQTPLQKVAPPAYTAYPTVKQWSEKSKIIDGFEERLTARNHQRFFFFIIFVSFEMI